MAAAAQEVLWMCSVVTTNWYSLNEELKTLDFLKPES